MPGIVVGVDESAHARRALDWAMREAALRQVALTVVTVIPAMASPWWPKPDSVSVNVFTGFPVQTLIEASNDAELVVIGSRGTGGFATLMLGSVPTQVAQHASCPVVIVHSGR